MVRQVPSAVGGFKTNTSLCFSGEGKTELIKLLAVKAGFWSSSNTKLSGDPSRLPHLHATVG
jgi:hypothetical protein